MVSNRQCSLTKAAQNPDEPAFEMTIAQIPEEIPADKVLLKVLVRQREALLAAAEYLCQYAGSLVLCRAVVG